MQVLVQTCQTVDPLYSREGTVPFELQSIAAPYDEIAFGCGILQGCWTHLIRILDE